MSTLSQLVPFLRKLGLQGRPDLVRQLYSIARPYSANKRCDPNTFKQPHMNDLPVACHDFQTHYNKTQKIYNMILVGGILFFGLSMTAMIMSGFSLFLTPCSPTPPTPILEGKPRRDFKEPKCD